MCPVMWYCVHESCGAVFMIHEVMYECVMSNNEHQVAWMHTRVDLIYIWFDVCRPDRYGYKYTHI